MNIIDQVNQNPLVSLVVVLVGGIGIAWKVFHALYVVPRDFRFKSLNEDHEKLKDEVVRLRRDQERLVVPAKPLDEITPSLPRPDTKKRSVKLPPREGISGSKDSPLSSLAVCYSQWKNETLTKLQRQKLEADLTGKSITWRVRVESVSEAEHNRIYLYISEGTEGWERPRASALFPASEQATLLNLNSGDEILLHGTIKEFFLWPVIEECRIELE